MAKTKKFPDNVVPVNFRNKNSGGKNMKELYPDAFATHVDTTSEKPDEFSRAVLDALELQKTDEPED